MQEYTFQSGKSKKPSSWNGGLTSEIFIYPEGAIASEKNYLFRVLVGELVRPSSLRRTGIRRTGI